MVKLPDFMANHPAFPSADASEPLASGSQDSGSLHLKYNPHRMDRVALLATLTGRDELLKQLIAHLRAQRGAAEPQHLFLYGPRGIGKTTLLLALRYSIEDDPGLAEAFEIVQLSEEERRISNLPSFAVRLLELLASARKARTETAEPLNDLLAQAREQPEKALDQLLAAGERLNGRQAVFLLDNFDELAIAAVSGRQRGRGSSSARLAGELRRLVDHPSFLLVATALRAPARRREFPAGLLDRFAEPIRVTPLASAMDLVRKRAALAGREADLLRQPGYSSRIAGLDRLAGGNPRLLVYLYDSLDALPSRDLPQVVQRLVDDLTPMYQDVIDRLLNRGQAAVLESLAARGGVGRVKEIAASTFLDEQTVRTFLGDLCELELVTRHADLASLDVAERRGAGRERVFRTFPPLFQIWYEMRHLHRESSIFLVHFLSLLVEEQEARRFAEEVRGSGRPRDELLTLVEGALDLLDTSWSDLRRDCIDLVLARGGTLRDAVAELDRRLATGGEARSLPLLVLRSELRQRLGDPAGAKSDLENAEQALTSDGAVEQRVRLKAAQSRLARWSAEPRRALDFAREASEEASQVVSANALEIQAFAWLTESQAWAALGNIGRAVELTRRADQVTTDGNSRLKLMIDLDLAQQLSLTGKTEEAQTHLDRARGAALKLGDPRAEALTLVGMGRLAQFRGEYLKAEKTFEETQILCRRIGERATEAAALRNLGIVRFLRGDVGGARERQLASLTLSTALGDSWGIAETHLRLVELDLFEERFVEAEAHAGFVLAFSRSSSNSGMQTAALLLLAEIRRRAGDLEAAKAVVEKALYLARECGNLKLEGSALFGMGAVLATLGAMDDARSWFDKALDLSRTTGDRQNTAELLNNLAGVSCNRGEIERAEMYARQSLTLARELAFPSGEAKALDALGVIALAADDASGALAFFAQAHQIIQKLGGSDPTPLHRVGAMLALAAKSLASSEPLAAEARFKAACELGGSTDPASFLGVLVSYLLIPELRRLRASAAPILAMVDQLAGDPRFSGRELAALLAPIRALLSYYRGTPAEAAVKDLGTPEIEIFRLLRERVERPELAAARRLFDAQDAAAARTILEPLVAREPHDIDAAILFGQALLAGGDVAGAEREAERVLRAQPHKRDAVLLAARAAEGRGDFRRSIALIEELTARSQSPEDLRVLAGLLRRAGLLAEAAATLRRLKPLPELGVELASVYVMAGDLDRAALALPSADSASGMEAHQALFADLLRVVLALVAGESETARRHASAALRRAASLPPGQHLALAPDFMARLQEIAGSRELRLFKKLLAAISHRVPAEDFAAEFLGAAEVTALTRRLAETGEAALAALKRGDLSSLADLAQLSTHGLGPRGALIALGESFAELPPGERGVALALLLEALGATSGAEALAALGALGANFARLAVDERERTLEAILDLAAGNAEPEPREGAIQVLNVLYPHLAPAERDAVREKLGNIRQELSSPALAEFFRETVPTTEPEP
ncbi:MAG TPA: tetratricopeptide repeat protein [Thermoanaerobaculia bacterium]|nr:tetratricopeptide repeat protein [Thermoanaerobaculia bacterium]